MLISGMKAGNNFLCLIAVVFLFSCAKNKKMELPIDDFVKAINNKEVGLFSKTIGEVKYTIQYKPADYMVLQETKNRTITKSELTELRKEYENFEYYTLEIAIKDFQDEVLKYNLHSQEEYGERLNYYAFHFQENIWLAQGEDTLTNVNYHFERNYGLAPNVKFLLAFSKADDTKSRTFICNEKYLGSGIVKINIAPEDLKEIPKLKIN